MKIDTLLLKNGETPKRVVDFPRERKMKKMEKTEKRKKNEEIWIHTQNPRRFPGFTVVLVTFFVKIL